MNRLGLNDRAFEFAARFLANTKDTDAPSRLLGALLPDQGDSAALWWKFLRQQYINDRSEDTLKRLRDLFEKRPQMPSSAAG
jgi:hypothetical protein